MSAAAVRRDAPRAGDPAGDRSPIDAVAALPTMLPLRALLNRIRWDPHFGTGNFAIGYYDRVARRIVTVPLSRVRMDPGNHFFFEATEADGSVHEVPFHRVREVRRDGELIWERTSGRAAH